MSTPIGLITPIVRDADKKGLKEISVEMKDLAKRAREKKLKIDEFVVCFNLLFRVLFKGWYIYDFESWDDESNKFLSHH